MTEFDDVKCRDCDFIINDDGCYFCQFGFEACKLRHKEKQKLEKLQRKAELEHDKIEEMEYYEREVPKEQRDKADKACKECNEYIESLIKKGKILE